MTTHPDAQPIRRFWTTDTFWRQLLITVAALLVIRLAAHIPIPGLPRLATSVWHGEPGSKVYLSLLALGLTPILSVLMIAESCLLFVPSLGSRRSARVPQRRKSASTILWISIFFAAFQGLGVAIGLEQVVSLSDNTSSNEFRAGVVISFVAVTALIWWLIGLIDRIGLGSGLWLVYLTPMLLAIPQDLARTRIMLDQGAVSGAKFQPLLVFIVPLLIGLVAIELARAAANMSSNLAVRQPMPGVWPAILADSITGMMNQLPAAISEPFSLTGGSVSFSATKWHSPVMLAVLMLLFFALQARRFALSATATLLRAGTLYWLAALCQIALCVGCQVFGPERDVPLQLSGVMLIIAITVAQRLLRTASVPSLSPSPAQPPG